MKSKNLLMFGVILVGIIMLAGSVSAALFTVTANPDRILANKEYNVTVTVTPCNLSAIVRLSGCDDKVSTDNGTTLVIEGGMGKCEGVFINLKSRKDDCNIKVEAVPNGYSYSDTTPDRIWVKEDSSSKRDLDINVTPACVGEAIVVIVKDEKLQKPVKEVDISVYLGEKAKADDYIKNSRGLTDDDGRYEFIPDQAGIHTLSFEREGYRYVEVQVDVCEEGPETTTPVTTTVKETTTAATTSVKETTTAATTSVKEETTVEETTTAEETTTVEETTTIEDGGGLDGGMMIIIIIVIVVIGGIIYFMTMRGGGEAEEEGAGATEEAVEEAAEEIPEEGAEELTEEE